MHVQRMDDVKWVRTPSVRDKIRCWTAGYHVPNHTGCSHKDDLADHVSKANATELKEILRQKKAGLVSFKEKIFQNRVPIEMAWKTEMAAACILELKLPLAEYQVAEMTTRVDAQSYRNIYLGGGAEI